MTPGRCRWVSVESRAKGQIGQHQLRWRDRVGAGPKMGTTSLCVVDVQCPGHVRPSRNTMPRKSPVCWRPTSRALRRENFRNRPPQDAVSSGGERHSPVTCESARAQTHNLCRTNGEKRIMRSLVTRLLALLAVLLVCASGLASSAEAQAISPPHLGQQPAASPDARAASPRRWTVSIVTGPTSSGPAGEIETAMRNAGLSDDSKSFFTNDVISHPFSRTDWGDLGFPWLLDVHYAVRPRYGVSVIVSQAMAGTTFGYRNPSEFMFLEYVVNMIAPVLSIEPRPWVRVGAGPAFYSATLSQTAGGSDVRQRDRKVGLLLDGSMNVPARSRVFAEIRVQYRRVGTKIGPLTSSGSLSDAVVLPATSVSYSHIFVGAGLGIRF